MSVTDELQERFDGALASFPYREPAPPRILHERLRRRRTRFHFATVAVVVVAATIGAALGTAVSKGNSAAAVTLYSRDGSVLTPSQLGADATIIRERLDFLGDRGAKVSISGGAILVTGGSDILSDHSSALTSSPLLLVRPTLCASGPFNGSTSHPASLPSECPGSSLEPVTPIGGGGFTSTGFLPDPALAQYPTTTPATDRANPSTVALLPVVEGYAPRFLVGPTQLELSSRVASARITGSRSLWTVRVRLFPRESALWDATAARYFHLQLAIDLDGQVVNSSDIQPAQRYFTSFQGRLQLTVQSKAAAESVAAALRSGPLPIPLRVGSGVPSARN
jgi:hypothetical protein